MSHGAFQASVSMCVNMCAHTLAILQFDYRKFHLSERTLMLKICKSQTDNIRNIILSPARYSFFYAMDSIVQIVQIVQIQEII